MISFFNNIGCVQFDGPLLFEVGGYYPEVIWLELQLGGLQGVMIGPQWKRAIPALADRVLSNRVRWIYNVSIM